MSIKYMVMVWECGKWEGSTLVMMLALADFSNDNGYCWPSIKTLAKKCRVKERQAKRIMSSLLDEENPGIEQARAGNGAGHSSMYRLIAENIKKGVTGDTDIDEERVSQSTPFYGERVSPEVKRVSSRVKKGVTGDTRSIKNHQKKRSSIAALPQPVAAPPKAKAKKAKSTPEEIERRRLLKESWLTVSGAENFNPAQVNAGLALLDKASVKPGELAEIYQWLQADEFFRLKTIYPQTLLKKLDEFRRFKGRKETNHPAPKPIQEFIPIPDHVRELSEKAARAM